jgi:hypothetical protein
MRISIQDSLKPIQDDLKPIQASMTLPPTLPLTLPLVRAPRPAQYALGGSALEWQGYRALCSRVQQKRARCVNTGPIGWGSQAG